MNDNSVNVDHAEIGKFEKLASRWWDPHSEFKPLHDINPLRLGYIDRMAGGLAGKDVLDVGCGGGILTESMSASGARVTGIDLGDAPLQVARLHLLESNLDVAYRKIPVETLALEKPASFDIVTCMELLEHVPDPSSVVRACSTLVRSGGHVFFSTLNRNLKSYLFAIVGAEYVLRMLPQGTHDYASFIRPSELENWIRASGLRCDDITGLSYNPINRSYTLGADIDVNYMVCCSRQDV